jgi:hypothetical protein
MSITCSMTRLRRALLAVTTAAALGAGALVAPSPAAPAPAPAPADAASDPAARITALSTVVAERAAIRVRAEARRDDIARRRAQAEERAEAARAQTNALGQKAAAAKARYEETRVKLEKLLVAAYRGKGSTSALLTMLETNSPTRLAYREKLVETVGDEQTRIITEARRARVAATRAAEAAKAERDRLVTLAQSLAAEAPEAERAVGSAQASESKAQFWLSRWQSIAGGTATRIMGPTLLSGEELARWFTGTKRRARITVPIEELTQFYVEEATAVGVRGDIAFAQSILETGGLYFPDGGQVLPTDNNFAGMGACDSCATGNRFADARTGVRAQVQQLRVYADPSLTNAQLNPPAVNAKLDRHFLKGKVPTWDGLTGTWATARTYGDRILAIYAQMLAWLTDRAGI